MPMTAQGIVHWTKYNSHTSSIDLFLPARNHQLAIACVKRSHQCLWGVMHKTRGIPFHPQTGKPLNRLVYCHVLSDHDKHSYSLRKSNSYNTITRNRREDLLNIHSHTINIRFATTSSTPHEVDVLCSFYSAWGFPQSRQRYILRPYLASSGSSQFDPRLPHVYHSSTLVLYREGQIVYSITQTRRGDVITYYDEITPSIALFFTYCLRGEGYI